MYKTLLLTSVAALLMFARCTPTKVGLSQPLQTSAEEWKVKGRNGIRINQKLSFGSYRTLQINRSATRSRNYSAGIVTVSISTNKKQQTIQFSLTDQTRTSQVVCRTNTSTQEIQVGDNPNSIFNIFGGLLSSLQLHNQSLFAVSIMDGSENSAWQLLLDVEEWQRKSTTYVGLLALSKEQYYTLHPITTLQQNGHLRNMPFGSVGFEIHNKQGQPVAAVSLLNNGVVYLGGANPQEKFLLANACAALLLHDTI